MPQESPPLYGGESSASTREPLRNRVSSRGRHLNQWHPRWSQFHAVDRNDGVLTRISRYLLKLSHICRLTDYSVSSGKGSRLNCRLENSHCCFFAGTTGNKKDVPGQKGLIIGFSLQNLLDIDGMLAPFGATRD